MKAKAIYLIFFCLALVFQFGCREPFEPESIEFLDALVVEGTITNELKHQEVSLSRTYSLEGTEPTYENNATVWVEDSNGNSYSFNIVNDGVYISESEFEAMTGVSYSLNIETQDGKTYRSTNVELTPNSDITSLYTEVETQENGNEGVQIMLDNHTGGEAQYFRYEFEETYKLVAPNWSLYEAVLTNFTISSNNDSVFFDTEFVERSQEEQVCFISNESIGIIQTSTNNLSNNTIERFPIKFIQKEDGVLRDRYSILVKQYVQSLEAYTYYDIINQLGENENILTQTQTGYVLGNISALNDSNEKVIGFFEVASVTEKRIYFNYEDFGFSKPDYVYECEILELDYTINATCGPCNPPILNERAKLYRLLTNFEHINYNYSITEIPQPIEGIWKITNPECGDCTTVGSNIRPDFWED